MNINLNLAKSNIKFTSAPAQRVIVQNLKPKTIEQINIIRDLYNSILKKSEIMTKKGIKSIEEKLPVTLARAMHFHKIGEYKTTLAIRISNTLENDGAMRIIERKSASKNYGDRIVLNSFVLDKQNRLIKNEDENNINAFWVKEDVLTKEMVEAENLEKRLIPILNELEASIKKLLEYINKNDSEIDAIPVGIIPAHLVSLMQAIPKENDEINKLISTIPKRLNMEAREKYPNYKFTTATSVHSFQNLGDEKLTISFAPIKSGIIDNLKRLYVYDVNGEVKDSFTIKDNDKMVTNINRKYIRKVVKNPKFATESELLREENLPTFEKYLKMYAERLFGLKEHIVRYVTNKSEQKNSSELSIDIQKNLKEISETVTAVLEQLRYLPEDRAVKVKKTFAGLYSPPSRIGITFIEPNTGKMVHVLPLKNHSIPNLIKLTITEKDGTERKYVLKDNKYVVKNYNPKRPKIIPTKLIFMNNSDLEKVDIAKDLEFFKEKVFEYEEHVRNEFNDFVKGKTTRNVKRR